MPQINPIAQSKLGTAGSFELRASYLDVPATLSGRATVTVLVWGLQDYVQSYDRYCTSRVLDLRLVEKDGEKRWVGRDGRPVRVALDLPDDA